MIPDPPKGVDLSSLTTVVGPTGMDVKVSFSAWQALLKRDLAWQRNHVEAKLCEIRE